MDVTQTESSNEDTQLCCRACMSTDVKLYNIYEYNLAEALSSITGTLMDTDKLPQCLCMYCCTMTLKSASFRDMCLKTQDCLAQKLVEGKLDKDSIVSNQFLNLTLIEVETIDYIDIPPPDNIKSEPNIDIVDIDKIIKKSDLKVEFENKKINDKKSKCITSRKRRLGVKKKIEKMMMNSDDDDDDDDISLFETKVKMEVGLDNGNCDNECVETKKELETEYDDDIDVRNEKVAKAPVKKPQVAARKTVKKRKVEFKVDVTVEKIDGKDDAKSKLVKGRRKRKPKRKIRGEDNNFMPVFDFASFEKAHSVKIVVLTKEEQIAEIGERKKTRNYLESRFRCENCGRGFDAEAAYNNHLLRHDPVEGEYPCEICGMRFKKRCFCERHQDVHRLKLICNECDYVSRDRWQARKHYAMHKGKTYECQHCGKTFSKSSTHLSHVRLAHPALNAACDMCGETFIGQRGLKMHKIRAHSEKPPIFRCSTCSASFSSSDALNRHTDTALDDHKDLRPCERCGENCASETALRAHEAEKHPKESYRCEPCNMIFPSAASYDIHHLRKHLNKRYSGTKEDRAIRKRYFQRPPPKKGLFVCEQCGRVAKNATLLRYHQRSHQEVKPFACTLCPKSFPLKTTLEEHIRSHTGEKPYQCPECPLAFSLKGNFNRHHKVAHQGLRANVPCSICGRIFSTNSVLRTHVNTVHHGQPWPKRDRSKRPAAGKNVSHAVHSPTLTNE